MRLERPLSQHLDDRVDEAALARVWGRLRTPRRRPGPSRLLLGAGLGACAIVGALVLFESAADAPRASGSGAVEAALGPLEATETATPHTLGDGSRLRLEPGARIDRLAVNEHRVLLHHVRGRALYEVVSRPSRSFIIDAGTISIEVTGTRFVVDRGAERVRVEVYEGAVVVRGAGIPDRVSRVASGDVLEVPLVGAAPDDPGAPDPGAPDPGAVPVAPRRPSPDTRPPDARAQVEDWLARADRARADGRPGDAVEPLEQVAARGGRRGALAHHTLGRLWMDELGRRDRAAEAFAQALEGDLPASLVAPALYRRFLCLRDREAGAARGAATAYLRARPRGPHAEELRGWLDASAADPDAVTRETP